MKRLTTTELANLIGLSPAYVRLLEKKGHLHPYRAESGYRYFGKEDIQKVVEMGLLSQEDADNFIKQREK